MTATHQLVAAVHTLGLCTRPLLLAGFPAAAAEAGAPPLAAEELGTQPPEQARMPVNVHLSLCHVRSSAHTETPA